MKIALIITGLLLLLYIAATAALYFFQRSFLYFPTRQNTETVQTSNISFHVNNINLKGWLINPGRKRALIYYGGNAEAIENNMTLFAELFNHYSIYLIPYRGYSGNPGAPDEKNLYRDALAIFEEIEKNHQEIIIIGRSLGTGVATYIAAQRNINKLILITPYDSIEHIAQKRFRLFPAPLILKDKYDSISRVKNIDASTLIIIADKDQTTPKEHGLRLAKEFNTQKLKVVTINQANHNDILQFPQATRAIRDFLK